MNTIEQPEAPGRGSRKSTGGERGARPASADIVLLLVTILTLMGVAAGIAIGFPMALEVVATQAHAAMVASPDTGARRRAEEKHLWGSDSGEAPEEEIEEHDEPLIVDDIRSEERMYAADQTTALSDRSTPQPSTTNR